MTPDRAAVPTWGDCPTCSGYGEIWLHPGARCQVGTMGDRQDHGGDLRVPCPTCEAHFAALAELRERCERRMASFAESLTESEVLAAAIRALPLVPS